MSIFRIVLHTIKIFIIFTICTLFFYFGLIWINEEYENYNRYNQPEGNALKVNTPNEANEPTTLLERVKLFLKLSQ